MALTEKEVEDINYRFGGYQLNLIKLDQADAGYVVVAGVHPYYTNQPAFWQKPFYFGHPGGLTGVAVSPNQIFPLLPLDGKVSEET